MKADDNDFIKRNVTANIIESNEVNFLCGEETLVDWKTILDFAERKLGFKEENKTVDLIKTSHLIIKLELVGRWRDEDAVFLVKEQEENDLKTLQAVTKIHKVLNHKQKEHMLYAFRNAGKLDGDTRQLIEEVIEKFEICKKNS